MSGILGVVAIDGPPEQFDCIPALIQSISPFHLVEPNILATQCFGLGISVSQVNNGPTMVRKDSVLLAVVGYIADDSLKHFRYHLQSTRPLSFAEQLIELYLQYGPSALQGLNGQYAIVIWDDETRSLQIINDRFGIQPFYYWQGPHQLVFSTSLKAIARHPSFDRKIDPTALFDLIAAGQMLGERTLLQDANALPPATVLTFANRRLTLQRYWLPALYQPGERTIPLANSAEQLGDFIRDSVCKHTSPNACLLLTGGLDSRWLAGALVEQYGTEHIVANTIGHNRAKDTTLSLKIGQAIGLNHQVIPVNQKYLSDYSQECVWRTEGNMNISASWILGETAFLQNSGVRQVITGVGAELVSGRHWLAEQDYHDPSQALYHLCNDHWQFEQAAKFLRLPYREEAKAESMALLEDCLRSAPANDPYSQYDFLHLIQHRRHPTGNILSPDVDVREPFFDNALVDFAFQIPPQSRSTIYKRALANCYPILAQIETTEFGVSVLDDLGNKKSPGQAVEKLLFRTARKLHLARAAGLPEGDAPWSTIYPNHWMRTTSREFIANIGKRMHLLEPWVDSTAVQGMINDHLQGKIHEYPLIGSFVTAVLWIEQIS